MNDRTARAWMKLAASLASAVILAHACEDNFGGERGYRDVGGGLVLTPEGTVVEASSLPGAVGEQDAEYWTEQLRMVWPATESLQTSTGFPFRRPSDFH